MLRCKWVRLEKGRIFKGPKLRERAFAGVVIANLHNSGCVFWRSRAAACGGSSADEYSQDVDLWSQIGAKCIVRRVSLGL
eukprot:2220097-Amphidinium_carterae.1